MSDGRAEERLEEAIEAYFAELGDPSLVVDWVLCVHRIDANDKKHTDPLRPTGQPAYRALGLVKYSHIKLAVEAEEEEPDADDAEPAGP